MTCLAEGHNIDCASSASRTSIPSIRSLTLKWLFMYTLFLSFFTGTVECADVVTVSIISANVFYINARKFFRREDFSIFLDHMINYYGSTKPLGFLH